MNKFMDALETRTNFTETEKGAVALKSTGSELLNLFASIGALRGQDDIRIAKKVTNAYAEDKLLALKILFYARNIRGGLGERDIFKTGLKALIEINPELINFNADCIPIFGRWDDLFVLLKDDNCYNTAANMIKAQLEADILSDKPSLLAKWLPSTASSDKLLTYTIRKNILGMSRTKYAKVLSSIRAKLNIVERDMCSQNWDNINYAHVPSRAMKIYNKAFNRHSEKFQEYIRKVESGEEKINSSTLYPYDIMNSLSMRVGYNQYLTARYDAVAEAQWNALPNYLTDNSNVLIVADTSGSMNGRPIETAVGLAIYYAERNKGDFHNKFMIFSDEPELVTLRGDTLTEKINNIKSIVCGTTNMQAVFDILLNTIVDGNIPKEDIPKSLVIISDMQFDRAYSEARNMETFYDTMARTWSGFGLEMPNIIFWNVDDRNDSYQVNSNYRGVQLVSGQSPSTFAMLTKMIGKTPYEAMLETLNQPMYDCIQLP